VILRDPVHGIVALDRPERRVVARLVDTPEVQRLRRIRQLGVTYLAFPGAEHSRFTHAIGTCHVMGRFVDRVAALSDVPADAAVDAETRRDALVAALLHDLGHGPYSHLFEEVVPHARAHEEWTKEIVRDPRTGVGRVLADEDPELAERVVSLLEGRYRPAWVAGAVSGPLDADRFDYLLRDSHMTGAAYGAFDLEWLLHSLHFADAPGVGLVLAVDGRKGLPAVEQYFLARRAMFEQVYFHKTSRAAEAMIGSILARVATLVSETHAPEGLPAALLHACRGETVTVADYLALDDGVMDACLRAWTSAPDAVLADLCRRLVARALFKAIDLGAKDDAQALLAAAREAAAARGLDPKLYVRLDRADAVPYAVSAGLADVWVALAPGEVVPLDRASRVLASLGAPDEGRVRLILPPEVRDDLRGTLPV